MHVTAMIKDYEIEGDLGGYIGGFGRKKENEVL